MLSHFNFVSLILCNGTHSSLLTYFNFRVFVHLFCIATPINILVLRYE